MFYKLFKNIINRSNNYKDIIKKIKNDTKNKIKIDKNTIKTIKTILEGKGLKIEKIDYIEKLGEGGNGLVLLFKIIKNSNKSIFIAIKFVKDINSSVKEEYDIGKRMEEYGIGPKLYFYEELNKFHIIGMEPFKKDLFNYIIDNQNINGNVIFEIINKTLNILNEMFKKSTTICCDIKPENFLINPKNNKIVLIDYGPNFCLDIVDIDTRVFTQYLIYIQYYLKLNTLLIRDNNKKYHLYKKFKNFLNPDTFQELSNNLETEINKINENKEKDIFIYYLIVGVFLHYTSDQLNYIKSISGFSVDNNLTDIKLINILNRTEQIKYQIYEYDNDNKIVYNITGIKYYIDFLFEVINLNWNKIENIYNRNFHMYRTFGRMMTTYNNNMPIITSDNSKSNQPENIEFINYILTKNTQKQVEEKKIKSNLKKEDIEFINEVLTLYRDNNTSNIELKKKDINEEDINEPNKEDIKKLNQQMQQNFGKKRSSKKFGKKRSSKKCYSKKFGNTKFSKIKKKFSKKK